MFFFKDLRLDGNGVVGELSSKASLWFGKLQYRNWLVLSDEHMT